MPTPLDIVLIVVMLISGLLAMVRGFMREVLSITAWVLAAGAALYATPRLSQWAKGYFSNLPDAAATAIVAVAVFLATLLIVSVVTVRISDMVLDSRVGALDRTLGFLFGLARGLLIVVVAFVFFNWLVSERSQPGWIRNAKSLTVLQKAGETLTNALPENLEGLYQRYKDKRNEQPPDSAPPGQHGENGNPAHTGAGVGYDRAARIGMWQLVEAKR
jgi:membrane protein required for colicin V production